MAMREEEYILVEVVPHEFEVVYSYVRVWDKTHSF
jgi:hypothetical protein